MGDSEGVRSGSVLQGFRVLFGFRRVQGAGSACLVYAFPSPPKPRTRFLLPGLLLSPSSLQAGCLERHERGVR